jgi:hypothetical protein
MNYLILLIISAAAQYFLPWWVIAPIAFIIGAWNAPTAFKAYIGSAAVIAILWAVYALFLHTNNEGIMVHRIGALFAENIKFLKDLPVVLTFTIITGLIGSQVAGFSALAGFYFKQLFK